MQKLTGMQEDFCREYIIDRNGTQAALRAGYAESSARVNSCRMLDMPHIKARIAELLEDRTKRQEIDADWVLISAKRVFDRCMEAEEITDRDGVGTGVFKFEASGANKALEIIGKHVDIQAFKEKVEVKHSVEDYDDDTLEQKIAKIMRGE